MEGTTAAKPMQQVVGVLCCIAGGLNSNVCLDPPELLILCHMLISQNGKFLQDSAPLKPKSRAKTKKDRAMKCKNVTQEDH